ncbi:MAG: hypothetical protein NTY01_17450 [Verrucomicrobia bacterium]|nr:hypothetical protein [Verrucomicrobiota bacterium]
MTTFFWLCLPSSWCMGAGLTITVDSTGAVHCRGRKMSDKEFAEFLRPQTAKSIGPTIFLCDPQTRYEKFDRALCTFAEWGLVIDPMIGELAPNSKPNLHRLVFPCSPDVPWFQRLIDDWPTSRAAMSKVVYSRADLPGCALLMVYMWQDLLETLDQKMRRAEFERLITQLTQRYPKLAVFLCVPKDMACAKLFDILGMLKSHGVVDFTLGALPKENEEKKP